MCLMKWIIPGSVFSVQDKAARISSQSKFFFFLGPRRGGNFRFPCRCRSQIVNHHLLVITHELTLPRWAVHCPNDAPYVVNIHWAISPQDLTSKTNRDIPCFSHTRMKVYSLGEHRDPVLITALSDPRKKGWTFLFFLTYRGTVVARINATPARLAHKSDVWQGRQQHAQVCRDANDPGPRKLWFPDDSISSQLRVQVPLIKKGPFETCWLIRTKRS